MTNTKLQNLKLESGRLCLDFANTLDWHASEHPIEKLVTYEDFLAWSNRIGLLSDRIARQLKNVAGQQPMQAAAVIERAHTLREAIYAIFVDYSLGETPHKTDLDTVNTALADMLSRSRLVKNDHGFEWAWGGAEDDLDQMLWWIIQSATDILTSDELQRVGQCADDRGCGWLFFDTSKNRTRRWCDMRGCGNRAKARRYYEKVKSDE
jgi:predicted RNA-binding Zn ribbon-like protein